MSFLAVLLQTQVILSILLFAGLSLLALLLVEYLKHHTQDIAVSHWLIENLFSVWLKALPVMAFCLLSYPALFGLPSAPPLERFFDFSLHQLNHFWNALMLAGLFMPLIPVLGKRHVLVIATQGMIAITLLFYWMINAMPLDAEIIAMLGPELKAIGVVLILAVLFERLSDVLLYMAEGGVIEWLNNNNRLNFFRHWLASLALAPALVWFAMSLSNQLIQLT